MTITSPLSYAAVAARLVTLGMISAEQAEDRLAALGEWRDQELTLSDVPEALVEFGVAVSAHGEDVDDLAESYRDLLEAAAACAGTVTVTGVELDTDDSGGEILRFRRDGEPRAWHVEHTGDYLDHLALAENVDDLDPGAGDPRRFHVLGQSEPCDDSYYVLATPEQARALHDEFGLDLG